MRSQGREGGTKRTKRTVTGGNCLQWLCPIFIVHRGGTFITSTEHTIGQETYLVGQFVRQIQNERRIYNIEHVLAQTSSHIQKCRSSARWTASDILVQSFRSGGWRHMRWIVYVASLARSLARSLDRRACGINSPRICIRAAT